MLTRGRIAPVPRTMSAVLGAARNSASATRLSAEELKCLATAVYFEARGEPETGQAAVAQVILNRVRSGTYPETVCGVVYQNQQRRNACQFSFACDGKPDRIDEPKAWATASRIAASVASGRERSVRLVTATNYHASYVSPSWAPRMRRLATIGKHIFYNEEGRILGDG